MSVMYVVFLINAIQLRVQVLNQIAQRLGCRDLLALSMVCKELQSQLRLCLPTINLGIPVAAVIPAGRGYIAQIANSLHKYLPGANPPFYVSQPGLPVPRR